MTGFTAPAGYLYLAAWRIDTAWRLSTFSVPSLHGRGTPRLPRYHTYTALFVILPAGDSPHAYAHLAYRAYVRCAHTHRTHCGCLRLRAPARACVQSFTRTGGTPARQHRADAVADVWAYCRSCWLFAAVRTLPLHLWLPPARTWRAFPLPASFRIFSEHTA